MASTIFTPEEARFLRLVMKLADRPHDDKRATWNPYATDKVKAVGEFRILIMGAPGVGKTSLLTKVRKSTCPYSANPLLIRPQFSTGTFPDPSTLPPSDYVHGCRRHITIDGSPYTVDALELPADHLSSPEHLRQALAITEAAVLVYDVTDPASLTYLKSLSSPIYEALHHRPKNTTTTSSSTTPTIAKKRTGFPFTSSSPTRAELAAHPSRPYHFLLVGTKTDAAAAGDDNGGEEVVVSWLEGQTASGEFFGPSGVAGGASASFLEVSALTGDNVAAVFPLLGREVLRSQRERRRKRLEEEERGEGNTADSPSSLLKRYATEGGAWDLCCSDFDFDEGVCADHGEDCVGGRRPVRGSVRRRWYAFKASLTRGFAR